MLTSKDLFIRYIRDYFYRQGFTEIQTPILANSSPEGARDFLIPSRLYPGKFYALPQAPQQFKQLLMVGGLDKYFQIAPCFRDEDPRLDRHYGEFYQLDMEMSFVEQEDIFKIMEPLMIELTEKFSEKKLCNILPDGRFMRLSWREAMDKYGTDKPDLRFSLEIKDVSELVKDCDFSVFSEAIKNKEWLKP
jgi:aspartyl-tRNA synthetase